MKRIYFTVTNDLNYDQRMIRICTSLAMHGFDVTLVGRSFRNSLPLDEKSYKQKRIRCWFRRGKLSYLEYNLRLLFLLFTKADCFCAIDLDTIVPIWIISKLKKTKRVYDAHELFPEMKEVISRPFIKKIWDQVEKMTVPDFKVGYTVSESIADVFLKKYQVKYLTIRNVPSKTYDPPNVKSQRYILYQGAVNEGRGLEFLIPAMQYVNCVLVICGDGNFSKQCHDLVRQLQLDDKVIFRGMKTPEELRIITLKSYLGINLIEPFGLNQLFSLANKFFDYMHAGIPQLAMNFREYSKINSEYKVALLIDTLDPRHIALHLNLLLDNTVLYKELQENCVKAREVYNWQEEEKKLIGFYYQIFS